MIQRGMDDGDGAGLGAAGVQAEPAEAAAARPATLTLSSVLPSVVYSIQSPVCRRQRG